MRVRAINKVSINKRVDGSLVTDHHEAGDEFDADDANAGVADMLRRGYVVEVESSRPARSKRSAPKTEIKDED